ncbi:hypothetical protein D557_4118 [Bordetella holmesii 70147]|nr:hypothetical protein D557_4118 [Bordetella holmesii 70147]
MTHCGTEAGSGYADREPALQPDQYRTQPWQDLASVWMDEIAWHQGQVGQSKGARAAGAQP